MTAPVLSESDIERFWSKVDKRGDDECWPWLGGRHKRTGHGYFLRTYAHRVALFLSGGGWAGQLCALHSCDNPPCCNPAHLRIGTVADNMRDKKERGRCNPARGERSNRTKLTAPDVAEMRRRKSAGERTADIAESFGISEISAYLIITRRRWAHVP